LNLDSCFVLLALGWMEFILNCCKYNFQSGVFLMVMIVRLWGSCKLSGFLLQSEVILLSGWVWMQHGGDLEK